MQKLRKRTTTNTPTDAPQVRSNCGPPLNKEETLSVSDLKTSLNNPEVDLSQHTARFKTVVYVLSICGKPLMPCSPAKAKKLLKRKRAKVVKMYPFTIQLNFECENQIQQVAFGIDSGYGSIGFSAVTKNSELCSGTVILDDRTSSRLAEKKRYRVKRRKKLWYRKARFMNRGNQKIGWLPPSVQRRYNAHIKLLKIYSDILPIATVKIETANFDVQKINNLVISGSDYQQGDMYGYQNMRSYLMSREGGKCQLCKKEFGKGNPSHIHHLKQRSKGGSNRPINLAILHKKCHEQLHKRGITLSAPKEFKAEKFMSIIQKRFVQDIPNVIITFGYVTFVDRIKISLDKTHYNDAFVIAGGTTQERVSPIEIKQKRRNNRAIQVNRKGFAPSIRRKRYPIQPKDLVWIDGKKYVATSTHSYGRCILVEGSKKNHSPKKVQRVFHFGSFAFK